MRISDWSSDVCSSDLQRGRLRHGARGAGLRRVEPRGRGRGSGEEDVHPRIPQPPRCDRAVQLSAARGRRARGGERSEEHTSELQSLMRISYAVFCLKKKNKTSVKCTKQSTHNNKKIHANIQYKTQR